MITGSDVARPAAHLLPIFRCKTIGSTMDVFWRAGVDTINLVVVSLLATIYNALGQRTAFLAAIILQRHTGRVIARESLGRRRKCQTGVVTGRDLIRTITLELSECVFAAVAAATPGAPA